MADLRQAILALTNAAKGKVDDKLIEEVHNHLPAGLLAELITVDRGATDALEEFIIGFRSWPGTWDIGLCCCGDDVDQHNEGSGHAPVDAGHKHIEDLLTAADKAIKEARRPILGNHL